MHLQINIAFRDNVPAATRRRTQADAALIADGMEFMTDHQARHIRPAVATMLARASVRRALAAESAARLGGGRVMGYLTLSGRLSTDPFFDPRSLRPSYQDEHEIPVDMEDHEPVAGCALAVSYRAFVAYSDAGTRRVVRVELLKHQTMEELRRGVPRPSYALNPFVPVELGLISTLMADANGKRARDAIEDEVQRHQADRVEELVDRMESGL